MILQIRLLIIISFALVSCNTGNLTVVTDLPRTLSEASGIEKVNNSPFIWMINDSGNKSILYGLDSLGTIKKQVNIKAKNHDWEDLASDKSGNLYIGDFGNNENKRKNIVILKVMNDSLKSSGGIDVEEISFFYSEQKQFPPVKNKMHFDCEAFFHYNDNPRWVQLFSLFSSSSLLGFRSFLLPIVIVGKLSFSLSYNPFNS